jgi:hypothetical protein
MVAYLEEHRKMEKCFQGLELKHIPRGENVEADEIAKRALSSPGTTCRHL